MKLYHHPLSGHSHRAHLFLSLLGIDHELIEVNLAAREHKSPEFLKMNPFGQIPVLVDGATTIADSTAILVYLAKKSGRADWLPDTPEGAARVQRWLSVASGEIAFGPAAARMIALFGDPRNPVEVKARSEHVLSLVDTELAHRMWLVGDHPTIADVALFSYIARANEGHLDLSRYANVAAWIGRVETLPGYVEFVKTGAPAVHAA
ncbi:glutathione S-transferase family protein [Pararobbsia silviterrae]|uniref:Glutathione S-transferase family protein n=1 Tax=Pararobbsia silviterrae TaxID=1792498 RepID=A0A494XQA3_9BURK|nr:glutathione S-transferase family protein [Pararobbsia silviterrae]RKP50284.1 glutathione S-transferase family protein [Pararobbsia silviterrae]